MTPKLTGIITVAVAFTFTFIGSSQAGILLVGKDFRANPPGGAAADPNAVKAYDTATGQLLWQADVGKAPTGSELDSSGNLWVADAGSDVGGNGLITQFNVQTGAVISQFSSAVGSRFGQDIAVADNGQIYQAKEIGHNVLVRVDADGSNSVEITPPGINSIHGLAFHPNGNLFASSHGSDTIFEYSVSGDSLITVNNYSRAGSGSTQIRHIAMHPTTGKVYASSAGNSGPNNAQVYEWDPSDPSAAAVKVVDDTTNLQGASGLAFDEFGNLYVGESFGSGEAGLGDTSTKTAEIYKYTPNNSGTFDYDSVFVTLEDTHVFNNGGATFMQYINLDQAPITDFTWKKNDLGSWNDASSWNPATIPSDSNHRAIFSSAVSGPTTVATNVPVTVNHISFDSGSHSYNIAGLGSVNLSANTTTPPTNPSIEVDAGNHQFQAVVNLMNDTTVNISDGSSLAFNNTLNLTNHTLTKTGDGDLAINNRLNTAGGTVNVQQGSVSGSGTIGGDLTNAAGTVSPGDSGGALSAVPEPATWILLMLGIAGSCFGIRKRSV